MNKSQDRLKPLEDCVQGIQHSNLKRITSKSNVEVGH